MEASRESWRRRSLAATSLVMLLSDWACVGAVKGRWVATSAGALSTSRTTFCHWGPRSDDSALQIASPASCRTDNTPLCQTIEWVIVFSVTQKRPHYGGLTGCRMPFQLKCWSIFCSRLVNCYAYCKTCGKKEDSTNETASHAVDIPRLKFRKELRQWYSRSGLPSIISL